MTITSFVHWKMVRMCRSDNLNVSYCLVSRNGRSGKLSVVCIFANVYGSAHHCGCVANGSIAKVIL